MTNNCKLSTMNDETLINFAITHASTPLECALLKLITRPPMITTQRKLRAKFWLDHPKLVKRYGGEHCQKPDTVTLFYRWLNDQREAGVIDLSLQRRATL